MRCFDYRLMRHAFAATLSPLRRYDIMPLLLRFHNMPLSLRYITLMLSNIVFLRLPCQPGFFVYFLPLQDCHYYRQIAAVTLPLFSIAAALVIATRHVISLSLSPDYRFH